MRLSFAPATRWSTSTPTRRRPSGRNSFSTSSRWSTPSRYSTTTPSTRRSWPHTFSTSSASCRPSTKMRLPRATPALASGARAPRLRVGNRDRAGGAEELSAGLGEHRRRLEHRRLALEQEPGAEREDADLAEPVLELHHPTLDADHCAAEPAVRPLDDEVVLRLHDRGRRLLRAAPVGLQN